jgi:hypothetical protein
VTIQKNDNKIHEPSQVYKLHREEKQYTPETHNQTEFKIKEITGLDVGEFTHRSFQNRTNHEFVNIKKELFFKSNGHAHIIFDVHKLKFFTVAVANPNDKAIYTTLLVSPDNMIYASLIEKRLVNQGKLEILDCHNRLKYMKVELNGKAGDKALVFLQGEK